MGKRVRGKDFRGKSKSKKTRPDGRGGGEAPQQEHFSDWVYENEAFSAYYKAQHILPEAEWAAFMASLATPLPTSFRVNTSCPFADRYAPPVLQDARCLDALTNRD